MDTLHSLLRGIALLLAPALLALSGAVAAEEIDVNKGVRDALVGSKAQQIIDQRNDICTKAFNSLPFGSGSGPHPCVALDYGNVRMYDAEVLYSDVKPAPIPISAEKQTFLLSNCSNEPRQEKKTTTISWTEGFTTVTNNSIRNNTSLSVTLPIKVLSLGLTESTEVSFSKQETVSHTRTVTEQMDFNETVPPMTSLLITIEKQVSNAYVDFSGKMTLDADLYMNACCGWNGTPDGHDMGRLSELAGKKQVTLVGQVWNASAQSTKKNYKEAKLAPDSPQCSITPSANSNVLTGLSNDQFKIAFKAALKYPSLKSKGTLVSLKSAPALLTRAQVAKAQMAAPTQVVAPFIDGMTITTGDVVGNVEVRAMSMGPGACGVTFSAGSDSTQFLAMPGVYSPWTVLTSNIGVVNFTLGENVVCDTGVVAEVRYWK